MLRKVNLSLLMLVSVLAIGFGWTMLNNAFATIYEEACPNEIGSYCPAPYDSEWQSGTYKTCHALHFTQDGQDWYKCCEYEVRGMQCVDKSVSPWRMGGSRAMQFFRGVTTNGWSSPQCNTSYP
jgi:hypothetical protein